MFSSSLGVHRQTGDIDSILQSILPVCSYDGVPFLMHDLTLQRTTNVHEVFPNRTDAPASMFTWAELERLNAGTWFLSVSCHSQCIYLKRNIVWTFCCCTFNLRFLIPQNSHCHCKKEKKFIQKSKFVID